MTKLALLIVVLLAAAGVAPAAEWTGYLMDTMCAPAMSDKASSHTADCMRDCATSGFGIVTPEGAYLKFNEKGNGLALKTLKASEKKDGLRVKVVGEKKGGGLQVESIAFSD